MISSETSSAQRARAKGPDFSDLFRSSHGSRHSSRPAIANGSSASLVSTSSPAEKSSATRPRRSMLPFLGRKKPAEQTAGPSTPPVASRKSHGALPSSIPVNTVRRSFGNGHAVLMITPSPVHVPPLPTEPPMPSKLPSMDAPTPSLGSKLAAHFTPLRSQSKSIKPRGSLLPKSTPAPAPATSPVPPPATLSPLVPDTRAPSIESQASSIQSRSTTPRPLRTLQPSTAADGEEEEDFSDLFTLPSQLPDHSRKAASTLLVNTAHCPSPSKNGEVSSVDAMTPPGPCLQFPIPPTTLGRRPVGLSENSSPYSSADVVSLSSRCSASPSKSGSPKTPATPQALESARDLAVIRDSPSQDERYGSRHRAKSLSGSEADAPRHYDSSYSSTTSAKLSFPKPPSLRSSGLGILKTSHGPPPSTPLPSPPLSPPSTAPLRSAPNAPSTRLPISPRPRAITLSITSNLKAPGQPSLKPIPPKTSKESLILMPDATADELRDALVLQRRKNSQLQDYIATVTKRYEDDRETMTRTIEQLERNVRKKTREIEGLRWLVIHNGAVSDIDAAANLARSSLSTLDGDVYERLQGTLPSSLAGLGAWVQSSLSKDGSPNEPVSFQSRPPSRGLGITTKTSSSTLDVPSESASSATSSQTAFSLQPPTPSTSSSPSSFDRFGGISRAERQKSKEERRAMKALRRLSAASASTPASGTNPTTPVTLSSSGDNSFDASFDPKQSMDEVLEKLRPFGNS